MNVMVVSGAPRAGAPDTRANSLPRVLASQPKNSPGTMGQPSRVDAGRTVRPAFEILGLPGEEPAAPEDL